MHYHVGEHAAHNSMPVMQNNSGKFFKVLYQEVVQRLFTLREVEVTLEEKGNQTIYRYKKVKRNQY